VECGGLPPLFADDSGSKLPHSRWSEARLTCDEWRGDAAPHAQLDCGAVRFFILIFQRVLLA
jgi:hypothetical protein